MTDLAVRSAKPRQTRYKLNDDYELHLLVMPGGTKHWRFDYRWDGAKRTLTIGPYPLFSLAEARDKRDEARKLLRAAGNRSNADCAKMATPPPPNAIQYSDAARMSRGPETCLAKRRPRDGS